MIIIVEELIVQAPRDPPFCLLLFVPQFVVPLFVRTIHLCILLLGFVALQTLINVRYTNMSHYPYE